MTKTTTTTAQARIATLLAVGEVESAAKLQARLGAGAVDIGDDGLPYLRDGDDWLLVEDTADREETDR